MTILISTQLLIKVRGLRWAVVLASAFTASGRTRHYWHAQPAVALSRDKVTFRPMPGVGSLLWLYG